MKRTCVKCSEDFDLLPNKPGFANVCPECTSPPVVIPVAVPAPKKVKKVSLSRCVDDLIKAVEDLDGKPDPILRSLGNSIKRIDHKYKGTK